MSIDRNQVKVDIWNGPIGNCGFRKGYWAGSYEGQSFKFFASVSHRSDLDSQERILIDAAVRHLAKP